MPPTGRRRAALVLTALGLGHAFAPPTLPGHDDSRAERQNKNKEEEEDRQSPGRLRRRAEEDNIDR